MVSDVERSIVASDLDSQGQFIALTNAIEMQLESGAPVPHVVRLLADAILTLAHARALPHSNRIDLAQRLDALCSRVTGTSHAPLARQTVAFHS
jgi:hypothetical protein